MQISIGVIGDLDSGPVFPRLIKYLNEYLRTQCKKHNVDPHLICSDSEKRVMMSLKGGRVIIIWTSEIPESLEKQISRVLKRKYRQVRSINNEDEVINTASKILRISKESVIRKSVSLLKNEKWFNDFCTALEGNFST